MKKKFEIGVSVTYSGHFSVEADTEEEALELAQKMWDGKVESLPGCVRDVFEEEEDV